MTDDCFWTRAEAATTAWAAASSASGGGSGGHRSPQAGSPFFGRGRHGGAGSGTWSPTDPADTDWTDAPGGEGDSHVCDPDEGGEPPIPSNWILASGIWHDSGVWDDTATWDDGTAAFDSITTVSDGDAGGAIRELLNDVVELLS